MLHYQHPKRLLLVLLAGLALLICSCKSDTNPKRSFSIIQPNNEDTLSLIIQYEGSLFPIPSPHQVIKLLKVHHIPYSESYINPISNLKQYNTTFKKALNFGVYGTNLSYLNVYNRTPESIAYLNVLKKLAEDMGIGTIFEEQLFKRIESNINQQDSLLHLISTAYRKIDGFLHENNRSDVGALILAGGWIESLSLLTRIGQKTANREVINRIGEQNHPLSNLIEVLSPHYYTSPLHAELVDKLMELAEEFDGIIYSYSYKEPKVDVENKIIYIHSQSRVVMSEYHLSIISQKVEALRKMITE